MWTYKMSCRVMYLNIYRRQHIIENKTCEIYINSNVYHSYEIHSLRIIFNHMYNRLIYTHHFVIQSFTLNTNSQLVFTRRACVIVCAPTVLLRKSMVSLTCFNNNMIMRTYTILARAIAQQTPPLIHL
jgi:hypothetical protein